MAGPVGAGKSPSPRGKWGAKYDRERHRRRSIRLQGYDYAQAGAYFVTVWAYGRECVFGEVVEAEVRLSELGEVVAACWEAIPVHFPNVELDAFVVMPNHVHGIFVILDPVEGATPGAVGGMATARLGASGAGLRAALGRTGATHASPLRGARGPKAGSVAAIIGSFKAAVTREINAARGTPGEPVWQRNYYERVIRDGRELERARAYVAANPWRWAEDAENPRLRG